MFIFGFAEDTFANYVFLCHDSAKHASMMALAAPSVRKNSNIFGFSLTKSYLCIRIELHTK